MIPRSNTAWFFQGVPKPLSGQRNCRSRWCKHQIDRLAERRSSTLDVDCCPMVVAHALKCSGPNLIIASTWFKEFYKQRDQVHFTTSVASDVEQRTSGPFLLCEDRVFVPSRLVTPVGKPSANRQMGGSKVFDSPFGGFHKWSYPNMVCKGKSEIEMDDN